MGETWTCPVPEALSQFLDETLEQGLRASIDRHIAECAGCQARLQALTELQSAVTPPDTPENDVGLSGLISRLCALSPVSPRSEPLSPGITFPDAPTDDAPLGRGGEVMIRYVASIGVGVAVGLTGLFAVDRASQADVPPPALEPVWGARFPNVTLQTHDGREVRFYDDLIEGKTVALNFMYVSCQDF